MAVTTNQIEALYLAYFNRPADYSGLGFQLNQANQFGLQFVADQFSKSPEYLATYGGKSTTDVIDTIYMNLFGRHAEPDGMGFWSNLLNNPGSGVTVGNAALTIFNGAINGDKVSVDNKIVASNIFYASLDTQAEIQGYSGTFANLVVKEWMSGVTSDVSLQAATSETALQELAAAYIKAHGTGGNVTIDDVNVTVVGAPPHADGMNMFLA